MESCHFLRKCGFDLGIGPFAASDATDVGRVHADLGRDPVVNSSIFRN